LKIPASFDKEVRCDGSRHRWSARLVSDIATYARGRARAKVTIEACGVFDCRADSSKRRVRLGPAAGGPSRQLLLRSVSPPRTEVLRPLVKSQRNGWSR
jgi:hypothetical protein